MFKNTWSVVVIVFDDEFVTAELVIILYDIKLADGTSWISFFCKLVKVPVYGKFVSGEETNDTVTIP